MGQSLFRNKPHQALLNFRSLLGLLYRLDVKPRRLIPHVRCDQIYLPAIMSNTNARADEYERNTVGNTVDLGRSRRQVLNYA